MSPSASVPVAAKVIAVFGATSPVGVRPAVTVGLRLACVTTTDCEDVAVPPLPSDTVTVAVLVPAVV